ncbi:hypothetical protein, partial [uncultured Paracoccus sp.]|uniref:hypothetical protein n=1 Tax=uncultured Paracoccus sp. TaxID=189685 RepID=UPI0026124772
MNLKSLVSSAIFMGLPVTAGAWEHAHDRGVDLYLTGGGEMSLSLVCDPNSVYGTTNSAVLVEAGGNRDISGPVQFAFPDGNRVDAELTHGRFGKDVGCCHVKFLWPERPGARRYSGETGRN